ncbi:MAG: hypothetical protein ABI629_26045 [bacterium]
MLVAAGLTAGLSGCVASGAIKARLHDGEPVTMHYRTERFGLDGTMTATMPDGQKFSGRFLQVTSDTDAETLEPFWMGWGAGWGGWSPWSDDDSDWMGEGGMMPSFMQYYSGKVVATMLGDRGGRMRCAFRLGEPEEGMEGGGVGGCQTGDKQKIDAEF